MNPVALRDQHKAYPLTAASGTTTHSATEGAWVVVGPDHVYHQLDATTAHVYLHADGTRDVAALAASLRTQGMEKADASLVHEALDRLADAGLLVARVAPPAGVSRRVLLQRLTGGAALAALTMALSQSRTAEAAPADTCGAELDLINEIAYLEAQEGAVADLLDTWSDELDKDPKADPFYADALRSREMQHKKREADYSVKLDDATDDLNACKTIKLKAKEEQKKAQLQMQLKKRAEEQQKKATQAKDRFLERQVQITADEQQRKDQLAKKPFSEEKIKGEVQESLTHQAQRLRRVKERELQEENEKGSRRQRTDEQAKKVAEKIDFKFISQEENEKAFADAYVMRASEAAQKSVGLTDYAQAVASEEKQKAWEEAPALRKQEENAKYSEELAKQSQAQKLRDAEQAQKKEMAAEELAKQ